MRFPCWILILILLAMDFLNPRVGHCQAKKEPKVELIAIPLAPIFVAAGTLVRFLKNDSIWRSFKDELDDRKDELVLWVLYAGTTLIGMRLMSTDSVRLWKRVDESSHRSIRSVLQIMAPSRPKDWEDFRHDAALLGKRYGRITQLVISSADDLVEKLQKLEASGQSFDMIQFSTHGRTGKLRFKESYGFEQHHFSEMRKLHLVKKDGVILLASCGVAGKRPFWGNGSLFLEDIGRALLPDGGLVFAPKFPLFGQDTISSRRLSGRMLDFWKSVAAGESEAVTEAAQMLVGNPLFLKALAEASWGGLPRAIVERKILPRGQYALLI